MNHWRGWRTIQCHADTGEDGIAFRDWLTGGVCFDCRTIRRYHWGEQNAWMSCQARRLQAGQDCEMDRDEIVELLKRGAIRLTMNDGSQFDIPSSDQTLISSISAHVLYKDESDNKWKFHILSLLGMVRAEELESTTG